MMATFSLAVSRRAMLGCNRNIQITVGALQTGRDRTEQQRQLNHRKFLNDAANLCAHCQRGNGDLERLWYQFGYNR